MTINIKDILTLSDNNDYIVISKVDYNNKTYYYLLDKNDSGNILFCYLENDELVEALCYSAPGNSNIELHNIRKDYKLVTLTTLAELAADYLGD